MNDEQMDALIETLESWGERADMPLSAIGSMHKAAKALTETRAELAAIGCLDLATACKERFGARLAYIKTPRVERGNPVINGDNLMRPGCIWTVYTKPKVRK